MPTFLRLLVSTGRSCLAHGRALALLAGTRLLVTLLVLTLGTAVLPSSQGILVLLGGAVEWAGSAWFACVAWSALSGAGAGEAILESGRRTAAVGALLAALWIPAMLLDVFAGAGGGAALRLLAAAGGLVAVALAALTPVALAPAAAGVEDLGPLEAVSRARETGNGLQPGLGIRLVALAALAGLPGVLVGPGRPLLHAAARTAGDLLLWPAVGALWAAACRAREFPCDLELYA